MASPLAAQENLGFDRLMVRGLEFTGNHAIDDYTLSISIATTNSTVGWQTWGALRWIGVGDKRFFDEREFRRDVLRLELLYTQYGYPDAVIDTIVRRSADAVSIRFLIHEGEPILVRQLDVLDLDGIVPLRRVEEDLPLKRGDPFNRLRFQASADSLRIWLQNAGYPFAEVFRSFEVTNEAREAVVAFQVDPGPLARIAAVRVSGTEDIGDNVVRRMIPLREGNVFRLEDLYASQRDLYGTRMFSYVTVSLDDSVPTSPNDTLVSVHIAVIEGNLRRIRAGAGYGSIDCFRGLLGWTAANFLGGGRTFDITGRVSKIGSGDPFSWGLQNNLCFGLDGEEDSTRLGVNYNVTASLREPRLVSRQLSGVVSLFAEKRSELQAYLREVIGGEVSVTWATSWSIPLTFSYSLQYGGTQADPATFCAFLNVCRVEDTERFAEKVVESTLGVSAVRERSNSTINPTRGNRLTADLRWAAAAIGSDELARYTRAVAQFASYHRLGRNGVLAWRVRLGTILPPQFAFGGQNVEFVPPDERFYGGGPSSVRGFGQNQLGPVVRVLEESAGDSVTVLDQAGASLTFADRRLRATSPTGGNQLYFANVELRGPLPGFAGRLSGAVFVDAGQVFVRGDELLGFSDVRVTPGVGVRVASPLGPVRFDIAYNPYELQAGELYDFVETAGAGETVERRLDLLGRALRPRRGTGVFDRLQLHFSVGQAF